MKGSGLEELFEQVYASNSVPMMISGKMIARAVRAHTLASAALMSLVIDEVGTSDFHTKMKDLYKKAINRELQQSDIDKMLSAPEYKSFVEDLAHYKESARKRSRTADLWFSYLEYLEIAEEFIAAERTSDRNLHLSSLRKMFNIFAATGHRNYAKSARIYHQDMMQLPQGHLELYRLFCTGHHTVRRSKKHWNGTPTDQSVEQTVMRASKAQGV